MPRSEERFSRNAETDVVCRLLLEKKKRIAAAIVTANSCIRRPTMPPMNKTGMNTAVNDSGIDSHLDAISFWRVNSASSADCVCSICRAMFSSMTMASSFSKSTDSLRDLHSFPTRRSSDLRHENIQLGGKEWIGRAVQQE